MQAAAKKAILRIELWHGSLLLVLLATLGPMRIIDPIALALGGIFMGINFLLLSFGVALILTPLAEKGSIKMGVSLLVVKVIFFLGLLTTLFYRLDVDAVSFAVGFSMLLVAVFMEANRKAVHSEN